MYSYIYVDINFCVIQRIFYYAVSQKTSHLYNLL